MINPMPIIAAILLVSCSSSIEGYAVDRAVSRCKDHGGIHQIDTTQPVSVVCRDGTTDYSIDKTSPISEQPAPAALKIGAENNQVAAWPLPLGPLIRTG
jgi:hypothetical protein